MKWIGLTGGIGSGKSTVAKQLKEAGFAIADADAFAHQASQKDSPAFLEIVNQFGYNILSSDGGLDRKKIGQLVFSDKKNLVQLERIIHPYVKKLTSEFKIKIMEQGFQVGFYDVPLLFEKNLESEFDEVVLVYASPHIQLDRLINNRKMNLIDAKSRIQSQISIDSKRFKSDYIIENNGTLEDLKLNVSNFLNHLKI